MVTPADVLRWTGLTISQDDCDAFSQAAEARLSADSGNEIPNAIKTALICYLIASFKTAQDNSSFAYSESIGGYSYSSNTSTETSVWMDMYKETLSPFKSSAGKASFADAGGLVEHSADSGMVRMNRSYSEGAFF